MKQWEDYLQPNGTLRNLLGITDDEELHQLEYDYTVDRSQKLILAKYKLPDGRQLTGQQVGELKLINGYLFGKVYDWAGHYREVDFNKTANGVVTFFHPVALFGNAEMDIQRQLDNFAMLPNDREQLAQALGQVAPKSTCFIRFGKAMAARRGCLLRFWLGSMVLTSTIPRHSRMLTCKRQFKMMLR